MRHDYIPIILEDVKSIFFLVLLVYEMIVYQMILYRKNNVKKTQQLRFEITWERILSLRE